MTTSPELSPTEYEPFASPEQWLAQYVVGSFYFSQGNAADQDDIHKLCVGYCMSLGALEIVMHYLDTDGYYEEAEASIGNFLAGKNNEHEFITDPSVISSVLQQVTDTLFQNVVHTTDELPSLKRAVFTVTNNMVARDRSLLVKDSLRNTYPSRRSKSNPGFARSLMIEHIVDGKDARHPVFNTMFETIRQYYADPSRNKRLLQEAQALENVCAALREQEPRVIAELPLFQSS